VELSKELFRFVIENIYKQSNRTAHISQIYLILLELVLKLLYVELYIAKFCTIILQRSVLSQNCATFSETELCYWPNNQGIINIKCYYYLLYS
jgi:hypothetical protein